MNKQKYSGFAVFLERTLLSIVNCAFLIFCHYTVCAFLILQVYIIHPKNLSIREDGIICIPAYMTFCL